MSSATAEVVSFLDLTAFDPATVEQLADQVHVSPQSRDAFVAQLREAAQSSPGPARMLAVAIGYWAVGHYGDALELFPKAEDGKYRRYYAGECALAVGRYDDAVEYFKQAASKGWDALSADMRAAVAHIRKGDAAPAQALLRKHERAGPDRAEWHYVRGLLAERDDARETALEHYEKALALQPGHIEAMFRCAWLYDVCGEDDRAIAQYAALAERPRVHVNALINLAVLYEDIGRFADAAACLRRVLDSHPNHARARLYLRDVESSRSMVIDESTEKRSETRSKLLETPITEFELSVRARNCLRKMNVNTLGDLIKLSETELLSYKNFGDTSLKEIKGLLVKKGLRLGQAPEEVEAALAEEQAAAPPPRVAVPPGTEAVLGKPVSELELSVRARRCLQRLNIGTVSDLIQHSEADLLATRNFGQTSLNEIKTRLADLGLTLAPKR
jgi:DNA-directed RNA polymerase subunit alpha